MIIQGPLTEIPWRSFDGCPKLETVDLPATIESIAGFAFAGCTKLRDLNLTRDGLITDISPIIDLPNLERVWWGYMWKFPTSQRREMRAKHKGCRFSTVYDPTSGGWRHHKHFKELFKFFRTGVYVPFSD